MGYRWHVRKTAPTYGSGYLNHATVGFNDLLVKLEIEYHDSSEFEVSDVMILDRQDVETAIKKLREEWKDNEYTWGINDEACKAEELAGIFETWLSEIEYEGDHMTLEAF